MSEQNPGQPDRRHPRRRRDVPRHRLRAAPSCSTCSASTRSSGSGSSPTTKTPTPSPPARSSSATRATCARASRPRSGSAQWVSDGGRWVALHGTNSALDLGTPQGVDSPRVFPLWVDTLGSQFVAHPPIEPYLVELSDARPLARRRHRTVRDRRRAVPVRARRPRTRCMPLLHTTWSGTARGFVESDWTHRRRPNTS